MSLLPAAPGRDIPLSRTQPCVDSPFSTYRAEISHILAGHRETAPTPVPRPYQLRDIRATVDAIVRR